jgi:hypothetical protein
MIDDDGAVKNAKGNTLGFINADGTSGDMEEKFLGEINQDGQAIDGTDEVIGKCELDHGTLRDASGSHWATIYPGGDINDSSESYRGKIDNFSFHKLKIIAAYVFFFDQALIAEGRSTKVLDEGVTSSSNVTKKEEGSKPSSDNNNPWGEEVTETLSAPPPKSSSSSSAPAAASKVVVEEHSTISLAPPKPAASSSVAPAASVIVEQHQTISLGSPTPAPVVAPPRELKPYKVGDFQAIENATKNRLEVGSCDCDVSQIKVRVEQNGQNIVFRRGEQSQRFALPYQVEVARVSAVFDRNRDDGTLVLTMTKPTAPTSGSPISGKFLTLNFPATSGEGKVTMSAGQTNAYFLFKAQGSSKYDNEVQGELVNGREVKFHSTITQTDKGTKTTSTQTFTVPYQIAMDHIQVTGDEVKVYIKHPGGAVAATVADADVPVTIA